MLLVKVATATNAGGGDIISSMLTAANLPSPGCWEFVLSISRQRTQLRRRSSMTVKQ
jgi:hypothetical protein